MKRNTIFFKNNPKIISTSTIAGPKECEGIVGKYVEKSLADDMFGEDTYEKAECKMLSYVIDNAIKNAHLKRKNIDAIIAGDLLNQIISAGFAARDFDVPFLGVYSACSTMSQSILLGSALIDGGHMQNVVCATGSHFGSAERQYRYPLEQGTTRPPQSQWTVTGAGALTLSRNQDGLKVTCATVGKVCDYGVTDVNNMGAAMAPAASDTILSHLRNTHSTPDDYDLILTGDLGALGSRLLKDLTWEKGVDLSKNHVDCGEIIYKVIEDEFQGGSGAGCSAVVLNSYVLSKMWAGAYKKILFCATGALLSTVSSGQGESIPGICHAVQIET